MENKMDMKNSSSKDSDFVLNKDVVNLTTELLFSLLYSGVLANKCDRRKPEIGEWCVETYSVSGLHAKNLGILIGVDLSEPRNPKYTIQTLLGQRVTWTNCNLVAIPSRLVKNKSYENILRILSEEGFDIDLSTIDLLK